MVHGWFKKNRYSSGRSRRQSFNNGLVLLSLIFSLFIAIYDRVKIVLDILHDIWWFYGYSNNQTVFNTNKNDLSRYYGVVWWWAVGI